jgi:predicted dehydrogenase
LKKTFLIIGRGKQALNVHYKILKKNFKLLNTEIFSIKNTKLFKKYIKMRPSCVVIAEAPYNQYFAIKKLLKYKVDIICEKPFCLNYYQAKNIVRITEKKKNLFLVNYQFRYEPNILLLKSLVQKKVFKNIKEVKIIWNTNSSNKNKIYNFRHNKKLGGGVILDYASHLIDYIIYIFGDSIHLTKIKKAIDVKYVFKNNKKLKVTAEDNLKLFFILNKINFSIFLKKNYKQKSKHIIHLKSKNGFFYSRQISPFKLKNFNIKYRYNNFFKKIKFQSTLDSRIKANRFLYKKYINNSFRLPSFKSSLLVHKYLHLIKHSKKNYK